MDKKIINVLEKLANKKIVKPGQRHFEYLDCSYEKDKEKKYKIIDGITYECDEDGKLAIVVKCDTSKTGNVIIPEGVTKILNDAFCNSKIESVVFPSSLKTIYGVAFMGCKRLKSIDFGQGIVDIGNDYSGGVFQGCENLEKVVLPSQIKSIGHNTFFGCYKLTSIQLNDGLIKIGDGAFSACYALKEMPDAAMMECINIYHQGGASALKRILAKTAKPYTAKGIYAALNTDPADPKPNQVGDYTTRQKKVYEFITKYADGGTEQKGGTTVAVRMSNCGHDENGRYAGGKAGDQTGTEWYLRSWYAYPTGGWNYILRWKDESLGNLFADLAIEAALNDMIGYDQGTAGNSTDRYTFRQQMKAVGYRPSKITKPCECDCSEGTIVLIQAVGHLKGIKELQECNATYTGNMMDYFNSAKGKKYFTVLQGQYLKDSSLAKRGDINLNTGHHVNVTVDNGSNAGKGSTTNTTTTTTGGSGYMFSVGNVQNGSKGNDVKLLQRLLKSNGFKGKDGKNLTIDGECGTNTVYAIKTYQTKKGLSVDGCAGPATWKSILLR